MRMHRDSLVTQMMDANFKASKTPYSYPPNMVEGMRAALDVAVQETLTIVLEQRCERNTPWDLAIMAIHREIGSQLLAPKTPEQRVTVNVDSARLGWCVYLDGVFKFGYETKKPDAEIYRLGLIQQLKESK